MKNKILIRAAVLTVGSILGLSVPASYAQVLVTDANLFNGPTNNPEKLTGLSASSEYNGSTPVYFVNDRTSAIFLFHDSIGAPDPITESFSISGFESSIDTLRLFSSVPDRQASPINIYYSPTLYTNNQPASLDPNNFTFLGTYSPEYTLMSNDSTPIPYAELVGLGIPTGTQTVLFTMTRADQAFGGFYGAWFEEVQGFAAVPEPSTVCLLLCICAPLLLLNRGTKRNANA